VQGGWRGEAHSRRSRRMERRGSLEEKYEEDGEEDTVGDR
jgi:hypothetical protein